jgi:thymidine kinase
MSLSLAFGPMNSSKTSDLLSEASRLNSIGLTALYVNHTLDTRSTDEVSTHNPLLVYKERLPNTTFVKVSHLSGLDVTKFHSILIDEGHFHDDLVENVVRFKQEGKHVHVTALIGDYLCRPIGRAFELIPHCNNPASDITFRTAYCLLCARERQQAVPAATSFRIDRQDHNQISIGGSSGKTMKYMTLCREHYDKRSQA